MAAKATARQRCTATLEEGRKAGAAPEVLVFPLFFLAEKIFWAGIRNKEETSEEAAAALGR